MMKPETDVILKLIVTEVWVVALIVEETLTATSPKLLVST